MSMSDQNLRELLEAVAAKQPTPGGGAVASMVAALAAALGRMVVNFSVGRKALAAHDALHQEALALLRQHGDRALALADDDTRAYARLNVLWKLDERDPKRVEKFAGAVEDAVAAPHAVLHVCMEILRLLEKLGGATNPMLASDLAMAAILADAAARSAAWNVRINLPLLADDDARATFEKTLSQTLAAAQQIASEVERQCSRGGQQT